MGVMVVVGWGEDEGSGVVGVMVVGWGAGDDCGGMGVMMRRLIQSSVSISSCTVVGATCWVWGRGVVMRW